MLLLNVCWAILVHRFLQVKSEPDYQSICTGFHSLLFHLNVLSEILNDINSLVIFLIWILNVCQDPVLLFFNVKNSVQC